VRIARKGVESSERLGRHRWQAEQTIAWLLGCRRLRVRYERDPERFFAFGMLACCRLAFNRYSDRTATPPGRPLLAW
jgi:Transposase DDE domain